MTRLQHRRQKLRLSQRELAERIGVEAITISRWERGESIPQPRFWGKLSKVTGLRIEDIIIHAGD